MATGVVLKELSNIDDCSVNYLILHFHSIFTIITIFTSVKMVTSDPI